MSNSESFLIHEFTDHLCVSTGLAFSPDGQILAAGDGCGELLLFNMKTFTLHDKKSDQKNRWSVVTTAYDDKGNLLAAGSGPGTIVHVYKTADHSLFRTMAHQGPYGSVVDMVFIEDNEDLVLITVDQLFNVIQWSVQRDVKQLSWTGLNDPSSVVIRPDGKQIIAGNYDGVMQVREINGRVVANLTSSVPGSQVLALECSPDSQLLAAGYGFKSEAPVIQVWNLTDGCIHQTILEAHSSTIDSLLFHPSEPFLFSLSSDQTIGVWNLLDGSEICKIIAHESNYGSDLALHPDGSTLASSSSDHKVKLWNLIELLNITDFVVDQDRDGMIDSWENLHGLDPTCFHDKYEDSDGDQLVNILEYVFGSDPGNTDTDGDTLSDHYEYLHGLNATKPDPIPESLIITSSKTSKTSESPMMIPDLTSGFDLCPIFIMLTTLICIIRRKNSH
ncbi:MAG: hypothetical protein ACFFC6_00580 [Promethearchaeota archaeon]